MKSVKAPAWMALLGAVLIAVITVIQAAASDHTPVSVLCVMVLIAAVGAFNVWATANLPGYEGMKKYVAAATMVLQALTVVIVGGITTAEWISLGVALLTGLGVMVVPHPVTTTVPTRFTGDGSAPQKTVVSSQ